MSGVSGVPGLSLPLGTDEEVTRKPVRTRSFGNVPLQQQQQQERQKQQQGRQKLRDDTREPPMACGMTDLLSPRSPASPCSPALSSCGEIGEDGHRRPRAFSLDGCAASGDESLGAKTPAWLREAADALAPLPEAMAMQQPALADSPEPLEEEEKQEEGVGVVEEEAVAARTASPEMDGGSGAVGWAYTDAVGAIVWQEEQGAGPGGGTSDADDAADDDDVSAVSSCEDGCNARRGMGSKVSRPPLRQLGLLELEPLRSRDGVASWIAGEEGGGLNAQEAAARRWAAKREQAVDGAQAAAAATGLVARLHGRRGSVGGEVTDDPIEDSEDEAEGGASGYGSVRGGVLLDGDSWRPEAVLFSLVAAERARLARRSARGDGGCGGAGGGGAGGGKSSPRTLVVCMASRLEAVEALLTRERLPHMRYEGSAAKRRACLTSGCTVVLSTYGLIVAKEARPPLEAEGLPGWRVRKGAAVGPEMREMRSHLHSCRWHRLVLLDAGLAANPTTQRAKAIHALRAERKWAVSGGVKGRVDPAALLNLVGCRAPRGGNGWHGVEGRLVREARGDLATLTARGADDPGGFARGAGAASDDDHDDDWEL